jgi:hypothetical protein
MSVPISLTPHNGLNDGDYSINLYNCCNIFLSNGGDKNTGSIYMPYSTINKGKLKQTPTDRYIEIKVPGTAKSIHLEFSFVVPAVDSTFTLTDDQGVILGTKTLPHNPDTTKTQFVSWDVTNNVGNTFHLRVTADNPQSYIFYFYGCDIKID